jgi:hypothetical protein
MIDAFYVADGDGFVPTAWTRGPWSPDAQHAGPPAALLARAIERLGPDPGMQVARFTLEVFHPIPVAPMQVNARVVRPGRRVRFCTATLTVAGREVAHAGAWLIRTARSSDGEEVPEVGLEPTPYPNPEGLPPFPMPDLWGGRSYFSAMEWRTVSGTFPGTGPAAVWMRMRHPLLPDEEPSPVTRVLIAADSGNGISNELPFDRFLFANVELSVHLARPLEGPWVCLDAVSRIDPGGIGLAQSTLWDRRGRIGGANQALLIGRRDPPR